ncbi:MAG: ATP-grasp domain-containing protein [Deltaproteobacteria bacterium]|nr:ATP-grasp domain-containing protein [Deltaproteobacteria bacterium]
MQRKTPHNKPTGKVLVLDGLWNKTLAVVRSLGRAGLSLTVGEHTRFATALFSRYCARTVVYPSPLTRPEEFLDWLLREVRANQYDMVLPTEFSTQDIILKNREAIEQYTVFPFGDAQLIANTHDKAWLLKHASANGFQCPKTFFTDKPLVKPPEGFDFPLVIKPRESSGSRGLRYVNTPEEFALAFKETHSRYPCPLIQEYIPSAGAFGVGALFNLQSQPRAAFVYKRLREYPVSGGPSTLRESVKDDGLRDIALRLLGSLGWKGLAMVEFRVDRRDGRPKLMEINPRLWGSLHLAIISGMDFPYMLYRMSVEGDVAPRFDYTPGIRCRWLIPGDLMHLLSNLYRFKATPGFFRSNHGDDLLSASDPLPIIGRLSSFLPLIYDREMRRMLFR